MATALDTAGAFGKGMNAMTNVLESRDENALRQTTIQKNIEDLESRAAFKETIATYDPMGPLDQPALTAAYKADPAKADALATAHMTRQKALSSEMKPMLEAARQIAPMVIQNPESYPQAVASLSQMHPLATAMFPKEYPGPEALKTFINNFDQVKYKSQGVVSMGAGGLYDARTGQVIPPGERPVTPAQQSTIDTNALRQKVLQQRLDNSTQDKSGAKPDYSKYKADYLKNINPDANEVEIVGEWRKAGKTVKPITKSARELSKEGAGDIGGIPKPAGRQVLNSEPPASENKGKLLTHPDGTRYKSDGTNWVPVD